MTVYAPGRYEVGWSAPTDAPYAHCPECDTEREVSPSGHCLTCDHLFDDEPTGGYYREDYDRD